MPTTPDSPESNPPLGSMPDSSSASYANRSWLLSKFDRFASLTTRYAGSPTVFALAVLGIIVWSACGPIFGFSETWQLVINTGTTIVTFLMVFLIQQSQNKDSVALHLKLNELLASSRNASNRMIGIEDLEEQELQQVAQFYTRLAERANERIGQRSKEVHSFDDQPQRDAGEVSSSTRASTTAPSTAPASPPAPPGTGPSGRRPGQRVHGR